jgi:LmbE family N-acetylglucosaminyl deacetylase
VRIVLIVCILALSAYMVFGQHLGEIKAPPSVRGLSAMRYYPSGSRILVVSPHPDDEVIATGGLIRQAQGEHRKVEVVIIMSGESGNGLAMRLFRGADPAADCQKVAARRVAESEAATRMLGLPSSDLILLGYSDGSLNTLWTTDWDYTRLHKGLNGCDHSPYRFAYQKDAPYCGQNVVKNLATVIKDFRPTTVVYPSAQDAHHDHWAANAFVQYTLSSLQYKANQYTYLVHTRDFPNPEAYDPDDKLLPPEALRHGEVSWRQAQLAPADERAKGDAMRCFKIPEMVKKQFLQSFVRQNELEATTRTASIGRSEKPPDLNAAAMPFQCDADASNDSVRRIQGNGGELTAVALGLGKDRLYAGMQVAGMVSDKVTYTFRMRIFRGDHADRLDVTVKDGVATVMPVAQDSVTDIGPVKVVRLPSRLFVELPPSLLEGARCVMFSADSSMDGGRMDKADWRTYSI